MVAAIQTTAPATKDRLGGLAEQEVYPLMWPLTCFSEEAARDPTRVRICSPHLESDPIIREIGPLTQPRGASIPYKARTGAGQS